MSHEIELEKTLMNSLFKLTFFLKSLFKQPIPNHIITPTYYI